MKKTALRLFAVFAIITIPAISSAKQLEISGDDTMRFNLAEMEKPAGEETTLVFTNKGTLPKAAMGHNFVLLKPGTDLAAFGNAAVAAAANEYIPTDPALAAQVVAHTKVLGPGESDSISFTITEPGEYPYICSFPGHWAIMKGVLHVK